MDCLEARPLLPLLARSGETVAELRAVQEHLAGCPVCQSALDAELCRDRELSQRMRAVPMPLELNARLLREVLDRRPLKGTESPARFGRRRWRTTATAIVPLMLLCGLLAVWLLRPSRVPLADLLATISSAGFSTDWPLSTRSDRPAGWLHIADLQAEQTRRMPQGLASVEAVRFVYRPARSVSPVIGHLWMVEAARISDANTVPPLELSQIQYSRGQPCLIWSERGVIYLLDTSGDVVALEQLQQALRSSRSVA